MAQVNLLAGDRIRDLYRQSIGQTDDTKPVLRAAVQAIEDWLESQRPALSTAINAATAPVTLTAAKKKALFAAWCEYKFGADK